METLGQKIKKIRMYYKETPENFARKLGVSPRTYSSYEYDERKPPVEFYFNMHTVYDVNLNWLIANDGDMLIMPEYEKIEDSLTLRVENILRKNGLLK